MEKTISLTRENYWQELKSNESLRSETIGVLIQLVNCKLNSLITPMAVNNQNKFENFTYVSEEVNSIILDETTYRLEQAWERFILIKDIIKLPSIWFEWDNWINTIG